MNDKPPENYREKILRLIEEGKMPAGPLLWTMGYLAATDKSKPLDTPTFDWHLGKPEPFMFPNDSDRGEAAKLGIEWDEEEK